MPTPLITPLPNPPSRSQSPETFSVDADAFLGALPEFQTDANAQATYLDALAIDVTADAAAAEAAAAISAGAANYQGDYNAGTTYQIGESVSYTGRRYVAKTVNTGVTPADGANWFLINDGDVLGPVSATTNGIALYDGTTGKLIKSGLNNGTLGQILQSGGSGNAPIWATPSGASLPLVERTSNTMLGASDQGKYIKLNGNFTQTFAAAATLGAGWWCYLENTANPDVSAGLGVVTQATLNTTNFIGSNTARQITFNADGTRFYYTQTTTTNTIYQVDLSVPNDITSCTTATAKNIGNITTTGTGICFGNNGLKLYVSNAAGTIFQYSCSTAFNIATAVYDGISYAAPIGILGMRISTDGLKIYISDGATSFRTLTLATAWSLITVTPSAAVTGSAFEAQGSRYFDISPDGLTVIVGTENEGIIEYNLSTAFNFSTATMSKRTGLYDETTIRLSGQSGFTSNGDVYSFLPKTNSYITTMKAPTPYKTWRASDSFGVNDITLDPNGSETIDSLATMPLYPNEIRLLMCDGTNLKSVPLRGFVRHFTTTSNFILPSGYSQIEVKAWGGGGSGRDTTLTSHSGGGGGGAVCVIQLFSTKYLDQTISITIGAGASSSPVSDVGGFTRFGNYLLAQGGFSAGGSGNPGYGGSYFGNTGDVVAITSRNYHGIYGRGYAAANNSGGSSIYSGGSAGGGHINVALGKRGGSSFYGSGGGGSGSWNPGFGGIGGGTGSANWNLLGQFQSTRIGGAGGVNNGTSIALANADTLVPFGCGGGGAGVRGSGAEEIGTAAKGGLGGGGGGGGGYNNTTVLGSIGGAGGDGFLIVRGII